MVVDEGLLFVFGPLLGAFEQSTLVQMLAKLLRLEPLAGQPAALVDLLPAARWRVAVSAVS